MNKSTLIPFLLLSTACFKQKSFSPSTFEEIKVSRQNDSLFSLIETPTFHATYGSSNQNASFIDLKSVTKKDLSRMSFWLAENAFKNNRLDIFQTIVLGTPLLSLNLEDQRNLAEQLKSLEMADISLIKDSGTIELFVKAKKENLNLEYFLVDQNHMMKIGETTSQSNSDQKSLLNLKIINTKEVLKGLSLGKVIYALPKDSAEKYNFFISNGDQFSAYKTDLSSPLIEILKLIDPKVILRGSSFVEYFLGKESNKDEQWQALNENNKMFLSFQNSLDPYPDHEILIDKKMISTGPEKNLLVHHHLFSIHEKMHLTFDKMRHQRQGWIENTYYAQELCASPEYGRCTARQLTPIQWKDYSVNNLTDLNISFYFKEKPLPIKPIVTYEHQAGVKTNIVKKMEVEIEFDQELFENQRSFEVRLGDENARVVSKYSGCLVDHYPQYVRDNPRYSDYNNAQFELTMEVSN